MTAPDDPLDLEAYVQAHDLPAEIVSPGVNMPTVDAAAAAMGVMPEQIFKSILFLSPAGRCVLVVASGKARVDVRRVEALTGIVHLKLASPAIVLAKTGYPAGGTPPVGHRERIPVVVDTRAAAQSWGYAGGGRVERLVKIRSSDIIRLTGATVADVTLDDAQTAV